MDFPRLSFVGSILLAVLAAPIARAETVPAGLCLAPVAETAAAPPRTGSPSSPDIGHLSQFPFYPYVLGTRGQLWTIGADNARQVIAEPWYDNGPNGPNQIMADTAAGKLLATTDKGLFTIEPGDAGPRLAPVEGQPAGLKIRAAIFAERVRASFLLADDVLYRYRAGEGFVALDATRGALLEPAAEPTGDKRRIGDGAPPPSPRAGYLRRLQSPRLFDLPHSRRVMAVDRNRVMLVDDAGGVQVIASPDLDSREHISEVLDMADGSGALIVTRRGLLALAEDGGAFTLKSLIGSASRFAFHLGVDGLREIDSPGNYRGLKGASRLPNALILYDDGRSYGMGDRNTALRITPRGGVEPFPGQERTGKIYEIFPSKELGRLLISAQHGVFRERDDGSFELVPDSSLDVTGGIRNFQDVPGQGVVVANPFNLLSTSKDGLDPTLRLIQCTKELCPNIHPDPTRAWLTGNAPPFELHREGGLISLAEREVLGNWPEFMPGWSPDETLVLGWHFGRYVKGGAPKEFANPRFSGRNGVDASKTLHHPSANALLTVREKQLYALGPEAEELPIEGADQLAGVPVTQMSRLEHGKGMLVEAGGKLFTVYDKSTPQARACTRPIEVEETSASLCAVRLRLAQHNGAYVNLDEQLRSFAAGPEGRSIWVATDHHVVASVGPGPANVQKIGEIGGIWSQYGDHLFTLPWLPGAVMQTRDDFWHFSGSGEPRRIGPNVQDQPHSAAQPTRWVLDKRRAAILRGRPPGEQPRQETASNLWAMTGEDSPKLIALPGPAVMVAALPETDTLLAVTAVRVEVPVPPDLICERGCRSRTDTKLWRLKADNVLEVVELPPAPARDPHPRDGLLPPIPEHITALLAWPTRGSILVATDRRLLSYAGGELKELSSRDLADETRHFEAIGRDIMLVDRGADRDALLVGGGVLAFVSDSGRVHKLNLPPNRYTSAPTSAAVIPGSTRVALASNAGALVVGDDGSVEPLLPPSSPSAAPVTEVRAAPWWNAVLINTQQGWRVLEADGRVRRIGGKEFQLNSRGEAAVVSGASRVVVKGYPNHEIVAIEPGSPSCDSRGFEVELPRLGEK
jgi:hypothetical protein